MPRATRLEMLKQQHGFLKRSIEAAMQGHDDEALRIATTIRVLVHETGSSKPLLKQLNSNYLQITILDIPPRDLSNTVVYVGVGFQLNSQTGIRPMIDLKNAPPGQRPVLLGEWWNRIMLIFALDNKG